MNMRPLYRIGVLATILALGGGHALAADSFTYQGELRQDGQGADGAYDMAFSLWDAQYGGYQVGSTVILNGVQVASGLFTVELDFGAAAFDNSDRWLEIQVNSTILTPRQPITRAPYAIHAIQTRGIFVNDAETFVGVGRTTRIGAEAFGVHSPVTSSYGGMYISTEGQAAWPFYGYAAGGNTDMWHYYDGATEKWHLNNGGNRLTVQRNGNVGIGTTTPAYRLHAEAAATAIYGESTGTTGYHSGVEGWSAATDGTGVLGWSTADFGFSGGVQGVGESVAGYGVVGSALAITGVNYGVYGVSHSPSGYDFYAGGAGTDFGSSSSIRWKRNVEAIDGPLSMLSQLRGVYFDWDEEHGGQRDVGMIAEEVGAVLPEIVQYEENGVDAIGMDYSRLTPLLVEAVKALRAERESQITKLENENEHLRDRVARLEALVEQLVAPSQRSE